MIFLGLPTIRPSSRQGTITRSQTSTGNDSRSIEGTPRYSNFISPKYGTNFAEKSQVVTGRENLITLDEEFLHENAICLM